MVGSLDALRMIFSLRYHDGVGFMMNGKYDYSSQPFRTSSLPDLRAMMFRWTCSTTTSRSYFDDQTTIEKPWVFLNHALRIARCAWIGSQTLPLACLFGWLAAWFGWVLAGWLARWVVGCVGPTVRSSETVATGDVSSRRISPMLMLAYTNVL